MPDELPLHERDSGIVGLTLSLAGQFDPQVLADSLPFEPVALGRKGAPRHSPLARDPQFYTTDYLKLILDDSNGIGPAVHELTVAVSSLGDAARRLWDALDERTIDAGLTARKGSLVSGHHFSDVTVSQLAWLRAELVITVYCVPTVEDAAGDAQHDAE